jgi:signal transduction histidine kinase
MTKKPEKEFSFFNEALSQNEIRAIQIVDDKYKVIVAYPQEHIYQTLNSLTDIYIVIAPIFFVISILGGALISQRSLSRIDRIIEKTEEITAQNLNDVIPGGEHSDEYGRLVRKMNEMISRIRTSVEYMNQFSISAAHELKTPLTILRGEIEVAIKSEKTPREYIEILRSNYEETLRLIKIVDNLFFISKSENSLIKLNPRQTDVREYFTSLLKNLSVLAAEKRIDIELKLENDFTTEFDNQLIKQAMINLVDNAVKYGTEKDPVIIEVKQANEIFWLLKVTNKVEELNSDKLEKIFDRFYRIESSRSRMNGGVGLGLAVVKSIALLHGGEINADKNNNELSIIMKLPL